MASPPPGWFPDPWRMASWRWWDGLEWTAYVAPAPGPSAVRISPFELSVARGKEERTWRWARLGLASVLIAAVGQWVGAISFIHSFHRVLNEAPFNGNGQPVRFTGVSFSVGAYFDLFFLLAAAVSIPFLIWQHSAATVARGLGNPARTSPAFGVGSWFIPVINWWFPYWALSDTLPPGHRLRQRCLVAWLAYLGSGLATAVTFFVALASTTAAIVPMIVSAALALTAIGLGATLIVAVTDDHRARFAGR